MLETAEMKSQKCSFSSVTHKKQKNNLNSSIPWNYTYHLVTILLSLREFHRNNRSLVEIWKINYHFSQQLLA